MKGQPISYSSDEMTWLEANRMMVISDYHRAFAEAFPTSKASLQNLHALRKRRGWKVGREPGRTAGRHWKYSAAEVTWLKENSGLVVDEYHRAFCGEFGRTDLTAVALNQFRKKMGWKTGRTGRFAKGQPSPNKGKTCPPGIGGRHPNALRTQFKKGQEPHNTKHLGHERINREGYVEISVDQVNPHTGYGRRYVHKHVWLWEQANGPVPEGHVLKCLDTNKANSDPSNWEAIPRGVLARLNGGRHKKQLAYNEASPELRPTVMALAKVVHRARELRSSAGPVQ